MNYEEFFRAETATYAEKSNQNGRKRSSMLVIRLSTEKKTR